MPRINIQWQGVWRRSTILVLGPLWTLLCPTLLMGYGLIWLLTGKSFDAVMDWWAFKIDDWMKWVKA